MKKRGFTLVELIAVLVILSILALIAIPISNTLINNSKIKAYNEQIKRLEDVTGDWALKNTSSLPGINEHSFVNVETLRASGFIDERDVRDPRNGKNIDGCILVSYDDSNTQYEYKYYEKSCTELKIELYQPVFNVDIKDKVNKKDEVEVNSIYSYPKVEAVGSGGSKMEVSGPVVFKDDKEIGIVDTSIVGTTYTIKYSAYDFVTKIDFTYEYEVKVIDTIRPVITLVHNGTPNIVSQDSNKQVISVVASNQKYILPTAKITDNSCGTSGVDTTVNSCTETLKYRTEGSLTTLIAGEYTITYYATDSSYNTKAYVLIVSVFNPEIIGWSAWLTEAEFLAAGKNKDDLFVQSKTQYKLTYTYNSSSTSSIGPCGWSGSNACGEGKDCNGYTDCECMWNACGTGGCYWKCYKTTTSTHTGTTPWQDSNTTSQGTVTKRETRQVYRYPIFKEY